MSHWQNSKIELSCSINILRTALQNIMPEWERNIEVDEAGGLTAINYKWSNMSPPKPGMSLVVRLPLVDGDKSSDIAFYKEGDHWVASYDPSCLPLKIKRRNGGNFDGMIKQEVSAMRARAVCETRGLTLETNKQVGQDIVIEWLEPLEPGEQTESF